MNDKLQKLRGFTLVELLVVIAIIGILVALLLPAIQAAREAARRTQCTNNMHNIILAAHNFATAKNVLPTGGFTTDPLYNSGDPNKRFKGAPHQFGLHARILPYIEEQALYDQIDWDVPYIDPISNPVNARIALNPIEMYWCPSNSAATRRGRYPTSVLLPSNERAYTTHYNGVAGPMPNSGLPSETLYNKPGVDYLSGNNYPPTQPQPACANFGKGGFSLTGVFFVDSKITFAKITDGTSHTLALGERSYGETAWIAGISNSPGWPCDSAGFKNVAYAINYCIDIGEEPDVINLPGVCYLGNNEPFSSNHPGGANFAMADASVTFINDDLDFMTYQAMASRGKEEVINAK